MTLCDQAADALKQGMLEEAISFLDQARATPTESRVRQAELLRELLLVFAQHTRVSEAIVMAERALALDSYDTESLSLVSKLHHAGFRSPLLKSPEFIFSPDRIIAAPDYARRFNCAPTPRPIDGAPAVVLSVLEEISISGIGKIPRSLGDGSLLVGKEGLIIEESVGEREVSHVVAHYFRTRGIRCFQRVLKGDYAVLNGFNASTPDGWFSREIFQAAVFESSGFNGSYLVPRDTPCAAETLEALGIATNRIILFDDEEYQLERVWVLSGDLGALFRRLSLALEKLISIGKRRGANSAPTPHAALLVPSPDLVDFEIEAGAVHLLESRGVELIRERSRSVVDQAAYSTQRSSLIAILPRDLFFGIFTAEQRVIELYAEGLSAPLAQRRVYRDVCRNWKPVPIQSHFDYAHARHRIVLNIDDVQRILENI